MSDATSSPPEKPPIDAPIKDSSEDRLARAPIAHRFARSVRELDAREGMVVGVLGPWGHGKSSFINLMREEFAIAPSINVIDFNPWLFSGSDQLVTFFFTEVAAELKVRSESRFGKAADWLAEYAGALKPLASFIPIPGATVVAEVFSAVAGGAAGTTDSGRSVKKLRDDLTKELGRLDQPIVVVVDDIDRLTTSEIREIFKLVRLTASFPNIIYLLAFDRARVEKALTEDGIPGRAYLEKIVQLSFDVPQVPEMLLRSQVFAELERTLSPIRHNAELDGARWSDVFFEVLDPLLLNMRDVARFGVSIRSTVASLGKEIDLVDLLALEATRVFRPELAQRLARLRSELTSTSDYGTGKDQGAQAAIDHLLTDFPEDEVLIRNLIVRVFPAAQRYIANNHFGSDWQEQWRTAHRVAHIDYLNLYFDQVVSDELASFRGAESAFQSIEDESALSSRLRALNPDSLEAVLQGLEAYEDRFTPNAVVPTSVALLNLIPEMPEKTERGFFDIGRPDMAVTRINLRLLRRVDDEAEREKLSTKILSRVDNYSSQLLHIHMIGHREGVGHKLVSEDFDAEAKQELVRRIMGAPPTDPSREWNAWRVYDLVKETSGSSPLVDASSPSLTLAVINSLKSTSRAMSDGSRHVHHEGRLAWDLLEDIFGGPTEVAKRVAEVRESFGDSELLALAERYVSGWRPEKF